MTLKSNAGTIRHGLRLTLATVLLALTPILLLAFSLQDDQADKDDTASIQSAEKVNEERGLEDAWETFRPSGMEAAFEMPKQPKLRERSFTPVANQPAIKVRLYSSVVQDGEMMFIAGWHDLHSIPRFDRQKSDILEGAVATAVANVLGSIVEKKTIKLERYPGREISYRFCRRRRSVSRDRTSLSGRSPPVSVPNACQNRSL